MEGFHGNLGLTTALPLWKWTWKEVEESPTGTEMGRQEGRAGPRELPRTLRNTAAPLEPVTGLLCTLGKPLSPAPLSFLCTRRLSVMGSLISEEGPYYIVRGTGAFTERISPTTPTGIPVSDMNCKKLFHCPYNQLSNHKNQKGFSKFGLVV